MLIQIVINIFRSLILRNGLQANTMKLIGMKNKLWHRKHTILVLMLLVQWGILATSLFAAAVTGQASATIEAPVAIVITTKPKLQQIQPGNFIPIAISESDTSVATQSTTSAKTRPRVVAQSSNNVVTGFTISGTPNTSVVVSFTSTSTSTSTTSENSDSEAGSSETNAESESDSSETDTESSDTTTETENMVIAQFDSDGVSTVNLGGSLQNSDGSSEGGGAETLKMITIHF